MQICVNRSGRFDGIACAGAYRLDPMAIGSASDAPSTARIATSPSKKLSAFSGGSTVASDASSSADSLTRYAYRVASASGSLYARRARATKERAASRPGATFATDANHASGKPVAKQTVGSCC